jgi:cation transport protein ChaC
MGNGKMGVRGYGGEKFNSGTGIRKTSTATVTEEAESIRCLVYIGLPENPQFLGPQDPDALAEHILESKGPSGENKEYLYNLETALLGLSKDSEDAHISDLAGRCRALEGARKTSAGSAGEALSRMGSGEELEEVER